MSCKHAHTHTHRHTYRHTHTHSHTKTHSPCKVLGVTWKVIYKCNELLLLIMILRQTFYKMDCSCDECRWYISSRDREIGRCLIEPLVRQHVWMQCVENTKCREVTQWHKKSLWFQSTSAVVVFCLPHAGMLALHETCIHYTTLSSVIVNTSLLSLCHCSTHEIYGQKALLTICIDTLIDSLIKCFKWKEKELRISWREKGLSRGNGQAESIRGP